MVKIEIRTGSKNDFPKMKALFSFLREQGVDFNDRVLSAHRTPKKMMNKAGNLAKDGCSVSIAAAGGSAHLAGMTASETILPVIALPIKSSVGGGYDSFLSMIQMPEGVPNACVGIGDDRGAGELAIRIVYFEDKNFRENFARSLGKKIINNDKEKPFRVNIITTQKEHPLEIFDDFGVSYYFNQSIDSFVPTIYLDEIDKIQIDTSIDHLAIISVMTSDVDFDLRQLNEIPTGCASVGVNRIKNSQLLVLKVLALNNKSIQNNLENFRENLAKT